LGCIIGLGLVSVARTDLGGAFSGQSRELNTLSERFAPAASFYFYLSAPTVGFSEYLKDQARESNNPWGRYTFASVYRFTSKLGMTSSVPFHQEFYSTPEPINTCTYLRELHADFGALGVFICPFLLGAVAGWLRSSRRDILGTVLLSYIYVVIFFSFTYLVPITGQWVQSLLAASVAAVFVDRSARRAHRSGLAEGITAS
jgi:oligosaccharide repeat unit polymerase